VTEAVKKAAKTGYYLVKYALKVCNQTFTNDYKRLQGFTSGYKRLTTGYSQNSDLVSQHETNT